MHRTRNKISVRRLAVPGALLAAGAVATLIWLPGTTTFRAAGMPLPAGGPLAFVANRGQWAGGVAFRAQRGPLTAWFERTGWTLAGTGGRGRGAAVKMHFAGARAGVRDGIVPRGERPLAGRHHFLRGSDPGRWVRGAPAYERLRYAEVYDGVDVVVRDSGRALEYDVHLRPHADLGQVAIDCAGVTALGIERGTLVMATAGGEIRQEPPNTWVELPGGGRRRVPCRYKLLGPTCYGFEVDGRDPRLALVVDPGIVWSTLLGDTQVDRIRAAARGTDGRIYVTGETISPGFPTTVGAFDRSFNGSSDIFVSCLDPGRSGKAQLVWSTFLGGKDDESGLDIAVDAKGDAVTITGFTLSDDFPVTSNAYQAKRRGSMDAIVVRLVQRGAQLGYSTYLGGSSDDWGKSLAVDSRGRATIAGTSYSSDFPVKNAYQGKKHGTNDLILARVDPSLQGSAQLVWSTYLGGSDLEGEWLARPFIEFGVAVAVNEAGIVTVASRTRSRDYPTTIGAFQRSHGGSPGLDDDACVSRLDPSKTKNPGQQLVWSTYLGGRDVDGAMDLEVDADGVVTLAGYTASSNFPTKPVQTYNGGLYDLFVTRLRADGSRLVWSRFLGGKKDREYPFGFAVESSGAVLVGGYSFSPDYPTTAGALRRTNDTRNGWFDGFVTRLDPSGRFVEYSTFLGGNHLDPVLTLLPDGEGGVIATGFTASTDFPTTTRAFQRLNRGGRDGFVTQLDLLPAGVSRFGVSTPSCAGPVWAQVTRMPRSQDKAFAVTCTNAPPTAAGALVLGTRLQPPVKIFGATLHVAPVVVLPLPTDRHGHVRVPLPLAGVPPRTQFAVQFVWIPTPSCRGPVPLSMSNALDVTVQQ